jgi:hypothetical protein
VSAVDDARWRRRPGVLWRRSLDAVIFLGEGGGDPKTLGGGGPELWELLDEPRSVAELAELLAAGFGADPVAVAADVRATLVELERLGAVVRDAAR